MEVKYGSEVMGFLEVLFLILLTLKLVGIEPVADWSWWLITAPLWLAAVVWVSIMLGSVVCSR